MDLKQSKPGKLMNGDVGIFSLAVVFIGVMHSIAFEDRLVLILYYLATVGSAYALVRRRAIGLASAIVCIVAATMFAQIYYAAKPDTWNPVFDAARDMIGLGCIAVPDDPLVDCQLQDAARREASTVAKQS